MKVLEPSIAASSQRRLLSLGCGDGEYELRAARSVPRVVGVDISRVAIETARARADSAGLGHVDFLVGDVRDLDAIVGNERFDVVWALAILNQLSPDDQGRVLRSVAAVLVPGGYFVSVHPNRRRLTNVLKPLARNRTGQHHSLDERELDPADLIRKAEDSGLVVQSVRYTDFFMGPVASVLPTIPGGVVSLLGVLDALLLSVPRLNVLSAGVGVIMRRI